MSKRPSFQFYPGDWKRDAALQSCSIEARGVWIELMCIMHEGTPYGFLKIGEKNVDLVTISRLIGVRKSKVSRAISELEHANVLSKTEQGTIYSRRMVKDEQTRIKRASGGIKSIEHPNTFKPKNEQVRVPLYGTVEGYHEGSYAVPPPAFAFASASAKSKNKSKIKSKTPPTPLEGEKQIEKRDLPIFLPNEVFDNFLQHRKSLKKPMTIHAQNLLIGKLEDFHNRGLDVTSLLNDAIMNGWLSVYEPKQQNVNQQKGTTYESPKTNWIREIAKKRLNRRIDDET